MTANTGEDASRNAPAPPAAGRLRSLDAFRGATIAGMILVNNPGDWDRAYWPLLHAPWHGWTPTDLVFPFFLFVVGVAIPYAFAGRLERSGGDRRPLHRQVLRRSALLLALGLFLNWFPFYNVDWATARIPGILQRIALVYLVAALAWLHLGQRSRVLLLVALLVGYWLAMALVPVPGHGRGDLGPQGNLAAWVDHEILGRHTWKRAPGPGDPEGLLSTAPAIATALLGLWVGDWLRSSRPARRKVAALLGQGCALAALGLALHPLFPINKNLWTSSYVLFTGGLATVLLAAIYWFVDVRHQESSAAPFAVLGSNAIFAFVGSTLMAKLLLLVRWQNAAGETVRAWSWLYDHSFRPWLPPYLASLAWALTFVVVWWALAAWLYQRKIFLKV